MQTSLEQCPGDCVVFSIEPEVPRQSKHSSTESIILATLRSLSNVVFSEQYTGTTTLVRDSWFIISECSGAQMSSGEGSRHDTRMSLLSGSEKCKLGPKNPLDP